MKQKIEYIDLTRLRFIEYCLHEMKIDQDAKCVYALLLAEESDELLKIVGVEKNEIKKIVYY